MILERFAYTPMGTFGRLRDGDFESFCVEEVWAQNARSRSCVPEGTYLCRRGNFPKSGNTFEVTGIPDRDTILFHVANTIFDVEGCIGPGEKLGTVGGYWAVLESGSAYRRMMRHFMGVDEFTLEIRFNSGYS